MPAKKTAVDKGRIALAVSPQKTDVVYATITTNSANKQSGFYRSEDAGGHWTKMSAYIVQDPEYYGEIYADPFQFDRVYTMDMAIHVTQDGGKTLVSVSRDGAVHWSDVAGRKTVRRWSTTA